MWSTINLLASFNIVWKTFNNRGIYYVNTMYGSGGMAAGGSFESARERKEKGDRKKEKIASRMGTNDLKILSYCL